MYHFIGLGGIGMSALARILMQKGFQVQGTDCADSSLLQQLSQEGARVHIGHCKSLLQPGMKVVYSSAVSDLHEELLRAKQLNLEVLHRSELLDQLMQDKKPLLVTGTHGKTTTSALLAYVLAEAGLDPTFVVGGIVRSFNTNGKEGSGNFFVAEADESDGSFLKTPGFGAIVTNLDNDHLNFWKSFANLRYAFQKFFLQMKSDEHLFWCIDDPGLRSLCPPGTSYGFSSDASILIQKFTSTAFGVRFDLVLDGKRYERIDLSLFGRHQALNGAAVFALALSLQVPEEAIRRAFAKFCGTKRRLEYKGEVQKIKVFDDYGHHPIEIAATIRALRHAICEKRMIVVFQPHRYTRLKDLFSAFTTCFDDADEVILTDIYSAGEAPIEGVTVETLYSQMKQRYKVQFFPKVSLEKEIANRLQPLDVVLTIGAGDITNSGDLILNYLKEKQPKLKVALLCGGPSAEHEVSIESAKNIAKGLDSSTYDIQCFGITKQGFWVDSGKDMPCMTCTASQDLTNGVASVIEKLSDSDVCFPVFHGPQGEDGMMQGFVQTLQIPYVGCDYQSAAICMHKGWTKRIALAHQIPTAKFLEIHVQAYREDPDLCVGEIAKQLCYPVWVKPVHLGSSIGVSCALDLEMAKQAIKLAFQYDDLVLVEEHVEGRQIEFGILGNEFVRVGPPCEILNSGAFVDYKAKYGASAMPYAIPARITELQMEIGIDLAKRMYAAAMCQGLARIDFFIDNDGHFWLNEINPFPGCTDTSAFPKIWKQQRVSMSDVCDHLIVLALHKARSLRRTIKIGL